MKKLTTFGPMRSETIGHLVHEQEEDTMDHELGENMAKVIEGIKDMDISLDVRQTLLSLQSQIKATECEENCAHRLRMKSELRTNARS